MEGICRACLSKHEQTDLLQYSEKNRRLFVYCTGLQVKRNDSFAFQLCKECYINMKVACNFKKTCRNSDKNIKKYSTAKESGEYIDIYDFLKHNEDSIKLRLPLNLGNSPSPNRRDDDNESTCTSIQNFMTDILQELPDSEANIIKQVIEEEADILEDSLDSHWLQDLSDNELRMDFSFSPFSTPRTFQNDKDDSISSPKNLNNHEEIKINKTHECSLDNIITKSMDIDLESLDKRINCEAGNNVCVIDINIENALKNTAEKVMLDDLLATPPVLPNVTSPATPLIKNILFGDMKETSHNEEPLTKTTEIKENIEVIDEFLNTNILNDKNTEDSYNDITEIERYLTKPEINRKKLEDIPSAKNEYCITNFYCKMCDRKFKNLVALKVHCAKYHKLKIPKDNVARIRRKMICDYCGKIFNSPRCIIKHIENHKNPVLYECKRCSLKFDTKSKLRLHQSTHDHKANNNNVIKKHVCSICGWACTSSSNYNIHIKRHFNIYMHTCEECGQGFYRKCDMNAHMRRHTGERPFQCSYCSKSFARHDALNRHIKRHTDERPYPCNFCKSTFMNAYDLKHHKENAKSCLKIQMLLAKSDIASDVVLTENVT
ncbi:unnamed protein product [Danaus chrysippus]|uniref:(African queen) hypothetical protein n=1 Tax=Danaus chrysippus TaxID=151541 RepID=A0A8J2R5G6_9NEOP|nr:unnamed protein product [Danaus chrysippus]